MAKGAEKPWRAAATFLVSAVSADDLPEVGLPEIAFAGRSNVGKSTLLNAVVGHKGLARTSNTPGRTRLLNFFDLQEKSSGLRCHLVDMPGYGYARAAKKDIRQWTGLIKDYLRGRAALRRVFLLIDARRGLMDADREILKLLGESAVATQVVLTKADKLKAAERPKVLEKLRADLKPFVVVHPTLVMTSSLKRIGIDELRAELIAACEGR